jgi:hypothetical protein
VVASGYFEEVARFRGGLLLREGDLGLFTIKIVKINDKSYLRFAEKRRNIFPYHHRQSLKQNLLN